MLVRILSLTTVLALPALHAGAQEESPPPPTPLEAADEAARNLDFEQASRQLALAAEGAPPEVAVRIKQRQVLYERFLALATLLEYARQNPDAMAAAAITRGGKQLQGRLQLLELGVTAGASLGNRRLDRGAITLQMADGATRTLRGREIAQLSITWQAPDAPESSGAWSIQKLRAVLHTGEVVEGRPSWLMHLCTLSVRAPDAAEDTELSASLEPEPATGADDLVTEVVILGGPEAPAEGAAATPAPTPSGPVSGQPEITR